MCKVRLLVFFEVFSLAIFCTQAIADAPPKNIFGNYGRQVEACYIGSTSSEEFICEKDKVHDSLAITQSQDGNINIKLHLHFFNGHTCKIDGSAKWVNGKFELIDFNEDGTPDFCYLGVVVTREQITLSDSTGKCTRDYCGTRGRLDGITLRREVVEHR